MLTSFQMLLADEGIVSENPSKLPLNRRVQTNRFSASCRAFFPAVCKGRGEAHKSNLLCWLLQSKIQQALFAATFHAVFIQKLSSQES